MEPLSHAVGMYRRVAPYGSALLRAGSSASESVRAIPNWGGEDASQRVAGRFVVAHYQTIRTAESVMLIRTIENGIAEG